MCLRRYYKQPSVTFGDSSLKKEPLILPLS